MIGRDQQGIFLRIIDRRKGSIVLKRRLKQKDIDQALEEIRLLYDEYITKYDKSSTLKTSFDERYYDALRFRMDLSVFFRNEKSALEGMEASDRREREKAFQKKQEVIENREVKQDTARKVWEENMKRIEKYPDFIFHDEASFDLVKLIGAVRRYEKEHWNDLNSVFHSVGTGRQMDSRMALEIRWREFCNSGRDGVPSRLSKYSTLLSQFPRVPQSIEWEERQILYDAARFLGSVRDFLKGFLANDRLGIPELEKVKAGTTELEEILTDFRLLDLVRLSGQKYI